MARYYNFSPGPAMLPQEVLEQIRDELLDWRGSGASIMEISHHSPGYLVLAEELEAMTRDILNVPEDYEVLFLPFPARSQFSMIPMNLLKERQPVDYICTGLWSEAAAAEAKRYANVNIVTSVKLKQDTLTIPPSDTWRLNSEAAYLYYAANETVDGIEFSFIPESGQVPLISDMTSALFTQPIDISQFGLIFAGAQKNFGIPALTVVIIHKTLLQETNPMTPTIFSYQVHSQANSRYCTPATFACYVMLLMLQWFKRQGGLTAIAQINQQKAELLYTYIDQSDFYHNHIDASCRSRLNIPFFLAVDSLNEIFIEEAQKAGLLYLKGHKQRGGMRASIYNSMPIEGVKALIAFMQEFERHYG